MSISSCDSGNEAIPVVADQGAEGALAGKIIRGQNYVFTLAPSSVFQSVFFFERNNFFQFSKTSGLKWNPKSNVNLGLDWSWHSCRFAPPSPTTKLNPPLLGNYSDLKAWEEGAQRCRNDFRGVGGRGQAFHVCLSGRHERQRGPDMWRIRPL